MHSIAIAMPPGDSTERRTDVAVPASAPISSPSSHFVGTRPKTGRVTDRWTEPAVIGVKHVASLKPSVQAESKPLASASRGLVGALPLPGMAPASLPPRLGSSTPPMESVVVGNERRALPGLTAPHTSLATPLQAEDKRPSSPGRHTRIPSTGNRATVMDVALALSNHQPPNPAPVAADSPLAIAIVEEPSPTPAQSSTARPRNMTTPAAQAERRKSSYEKYSAITLPPLKEEATPTPSPAGTLMRARGVADMESPNVIEAVQRAVTSATAASNGAVVARSGKPPLG
jgi:hypothetical protein